ncbi:MAG: class I SAM-dependent methyltransferase [Sterolibacteriaceae bacterium]|nr:class I SAM-dependent methyltransferase [Candidatus Methylophosphatis haderslevensis]
MGYIAPMSRPDAAPPAYRDTEWWRDHFSGGMLDLWQAIVPPEQALEDANFLLAHGGVRPAGRVLDVPCGDGRVAIELAARGVRMVGVDISAGQIEAARVKSAARNLAIEWHVADMRSVPWRASFDAGFCWGDSFGYMDEAGNRDFLAAVHRALVPGAGWAMEMQMVAELLLPRLQRRVSGRAGEFDVAVRREFDEQSGRLAVEYELARNGVRETRQASYRIHSVAEIRALLADAGFAIDRLCARNGEPFTAEADRLRVVCRAPGPPG